jgi:dihydroxy-acid dehydratase
VRNGDRIRLSARNREITLLVSEVELASRREARPVTASSPERGFAKLFYETVTQADKGVDFDFLRPKVRSDKVPKAR